jgi:tetratricopeptide (TPR) repeat protein
MHNRIIGWNEVMATPKKLWGRGGGFPALFPNASSPEHGVYAVSSFGESRVNRFVDAVRMLKRLEGLIAPWMAGFGQGANSQISNLSFQNARHSDSKAGCDLKSRRPWPLWFAIWNHPGACRLVLGVFMLLTSSVVQAAEVAIPDLPRVSAGTVSNRVYRAYVEYRAQYAREPTNGHVAWKFGRACFRRADFSTNGAQRAALAEEGIAASRKGIELAPDSAAPYFYLGVNLGQLARTKLFTALGLLDDMEAAWKESIELDPTFHHAAAHRSLGLLYLDAPGWPLSLGSRTKAQRHLQKAAELVPDFPENRLSLLEARLRWGEAKAIQRQFAAMETTMRAARARFTGEAWQEDWEDWDARWKIIKAKADAAANARSPRDTR